LVTGGGTGLASACATAIAAAGARVIICRPDDGPKVP
jgi:NAD(P)-dependent dehydrogenase (short-subunit alcohol dehydrogenase family)